MIEDYNQTQEEIDKMAFTLDRSQFPRSSSFTNGENTETVAPPVLEVAPKKVGKVTVTVPRIMRISEFFYTLCKEHEIEQMQSWLLEF